MSISKGGQSVKPYVGSKEVKEAYVGSALVYQNVPNYEYPPYVMNKGYTALEINSSRYATFVEGTGIVFTKASTGLPLVRFNTPEAIKTNKKGVVVVNGTSYSFNYPKPSFMGYTVIAIQITNSAPYTVKVGYYSAGNSYTTNITTIKNGFVNINLVFELDLAVSSYFSFDDIPVPYRPTKAYNCCCAVGNSQWTVNEVGYLYIQYKITGQIKDDGSGSKKWVKINVTYPIANENY